MKQTGRVAEVIRNKVKVVFKRSDACGRCHACFRLGSDEAEIIIDNLLNAKVGDVVIIEMHAKSVLKASLISYGIPIIALIVGAYAGSGISDIMSAAGGICAAAGSFFILRGLEPRFSKMTEFAPRMVGIETQK